VNLSVFDLAGREVATLADGHFAAGEHVLSWNGHDKAGNLLPSGAYMYRLKSAGETQIQKLVFIR
jgi:flagellar hook assembly protein FlgD